MKAVTSPATKMSVTAASPRLRLIPKREESQRKSRPVRAVAAQHTASERHKRTWRSRRATGSNLDFRDLSILSLSRACPYLHRVTAKVQERFHAIWRAGWASAPRGRDDERRVQLLVGIPHLCGPLAFRMPP